MTTTAGHGPTRAGVLRDAWAHGPGKDVVVDPGVVVAAPAGPPGTPLDAIAASWPPGAELAAALTAALAPDRWDDWSSYNAHRPFPSPRAKHPHRCSLVLASGVHPIDEVRSTFAPDPVDGPLPVATPVALLVESDPGAVPAGYGRLREALGCLEVGHVVEAVAVAARTRGFEVQVQPAQQRSGRIAVLVEFTAGRVFPRTAPAAARRCSGLDPRGLSADPRPLPATTWDRLLELAPRTDARSRHLLAVRGVQDRQDGVWEASADGPVLRRPGAVGDVLGRAFRGPLGTADVAGMNVVWGIGADVAGAVRTSPGQYPRLLVDAGRAGQRLCLAAARAGLFCRPVRGVEEPDVEAALGLAATEDLLYVLLLGRPRVHGFTYDLTPAPPPEERTP